MFATFRTCPTALACVEVVASAASGDAATAYFHLISSSAEVSFPTSPKVDPQDQDFGDTSPFQDKKTTKGHH